MNKDEVIYVQTLTPCSVLYKEVGISTLYSLMIASGEKSHLNQYIWPQLLSYPESVSRMG